MPQKQLQEALATLHEELAAADALNEDERTALLEMIAEIKEALGPEVDGEAATQAPLSGRVASLIEEFEATHPKFAEILRNVSESLANIGI